MNKFSKFLSNKACKFCAFITKHCAPYEVRCNFGTRQATWTLQEAISWLSACGDVAIVVHRGTGELLVNRNN